MSILNFSTSKKLKANSSCSLHSIALHVGQDFIQGRSANYYAGGGGGRAAKFPTTGTIFSNKLILFNFS